MKNSPTNWTVLDYWSKILDSYRISIQNFCTPSIIKGYFLTLPFPQGDLFGSPSHRLLLFFKKSSRLTGERRPQIRTKRNVLIKTIVFRYPVPAGDGVSAMTTSTRKNRMTQIRSVLWILKIPLWPNKSMNLVMILTWSLKENHPTTNLSGDTCSMKKRKRPRWILTNTMR